MSLDRRLLFWKSWFQAKRWKPEWQAQLSQSLHAAQKDLKLSMVVVVARESDLYPEILYSFSFLGLMLASCAALILNWFFPSLPAHFLIVLPVLGFSAGGLSHMGRERLLRTIFRRLAQEKVQLKAKAYFFEHTQQFKGRLVLLYLSETEHVARFLGSAELLAQLPSSELQQLLTRLEHGYSRRRPLQALQPCLEDLGRLLHQHFQEADHETEVVFAPPLFVGATDRNITVVPILKGNKDIN